MQSILELLYLQLQRQVLLVLLEAGLVLLQVLLNVPLPQIVHLLQHLDRLLLLTQHLLQLHVFLFLLGANVLQPLGHVVLFVFLSSNDGLLFGAHLVLDEAELFIHELRHPLLPLLLLLGLLIDLAQDALMVRLKDDLTALVALLRLLDLLRHHLRILLEAHFDLVFTVLYFIIQLLSMLVGVLCIGHELFVVVSLLTFDIGHIILELLEPLRL